MLEIEASHAEFASVLRRMGRDGNTLSKTIRQGWDPGTLGTMTRNAALRATNVHISIITHVTPADLTDFLDYFDGEWVREPFYLHRDTTCS